jgi:hypothetical protein
VALLSHFPDGRAYRDPSLSLPLGWGFPFGPPARAEARQAKVLTRDEARRMAVKFARLPRCEAQGAIVREGTQPPLRRFPGVSRGEQDARLPQTLPDALRDLSPLPLGAVSRPA